MKIRILSGAVTAAIVVVVVAIGTRIPLVFNAAMGFLGAVAVHEILENTSLCNNRYLKLSGCMLAVVLPFLSKKLIPLDFSLVIMVFCIVQLLIALKFHAEVSVSSVSSAIAFPILLSYAFTTLGEILRTTVGSGLFYLLIILCFSAVADTAAYFVGVRFGKHKMSPVISPKKTFEGAIGGIAASLIFSLLVCLCFSIIFNYTVNYTAILIAAPFFALLGMAGDLIASYIKRGCNIKDYGNIIPGHGGILDRFDSILMIAPVFYKFIQIMSPENIIL